MYEPVTGWVAIASAVVSSVSAIVALMILVKIIVRMAEEEARLHLEEDRRKVELELIAQQSGGLSEQSERLGRAIADVLEQVEALREAGTGGVRARRVQHAPGQAAVADRIGPTRGDSEPSKDVEVKGREALLAAKLGTIDDVIASINSLGTLIRSELSRGKSGLYGSYIQDISYLKEIETAIDEVAGIKQEIPAVLADDLLKAANRWRAIFNFKDEGGPEFTYFPGARNDDQVARKAIIGLIERADELLNKKRDTLLKYLADSRSGSGVGGGTPRAAEPAGCGG